MKNNKYRNLNQIQKNIRVSIMDMIIEKERPVSLDESVVFLEDKLNLKKEYIKETLKLFIDKNIMVVDDDGYINFIYPVSAHPTMHRVTLEDKREFNAMCAIDAMGWRCTFNQDIDIKSRCYVTGNEINISIKDGKVTSLNNPDLRVLHLNLDKHENWAANCWNIMNFFWTKNEFDEWVKENGFENDEDIYCLDINEAMDASYDIFYVG